MYWVVGRETGPCVGSVADQFALRRKELSRTRLFAFGTVILATEVQSGAISSENVSVISAAAPDVSLDQVALVDVWDLMPSSRRIH